MSLILDGTNGLSDVDGSAGTPAIRGSDANTGIFFPAADTIAFAEGGVESMRLNSSGNVGIGTSSPVSRLHVVGPQDQILAGNGTVVSFLGGSGTDGYTGTFTNHPFTFYTNSSERMRIDSSGTLLVGTTSGTVINAASGSGGFNYYANSYLGVATNSEITAYWNRIGTDGTVHAMRKNGTTVGTIGVTASATSYNTSSDYRLKENIVPMTGALAKVAALKPCTYRWKVDGSDGQGFIAHELAEVEPGCVTGEKDAVDADGNPQYQGIDTSFLVATLTAAIQEQQALITSLTARVVALEGQA